MPFSRRKPDRNPLQRLSDQRRSVALAGLAVGAVVGTTFFRRRRRGEEVEIESVVEVVEVDVAVPVREPVPEPVPAGEPVSTSESEPEEEPRPINAAPSAEPATTPAPAPAPVEPATGELSTEEAGILAVLAQSGRSDDDRTALAVATSLDRDTGEVTEVLRKLGAEGVVSGAAQTSSGEEIWAVTERGVRRLGAQS